MSETGVDAQRAVMIGDTSYDMDMGNAAGMATIGVTWGYHDANRLAAANVLVQSMYDVPATATMSEWKQKRFWDSASAVADGDQWAVALDGRVLKTPAKAPMLVPTQKLADAIATEWDAQEDVINPLVMPFTRSANAAIDKVAHQRAEVADMLAAYGDADLLCYRADSPIGLG
ncbi:ATP synthase mitochondrial F1 complex assembly factor 2 [Nymphon striatum]|nr:ATP synthase mitochondrial F1 complex assembly factor 2 [Nymphon striatum]